MAVTKANTQVKWNGGNNDYTLTSGSAISGDAHTFYGSSVMAMITLKADNTGTPASGDTVDFYLLYTTGDPDGSSVEEYDTVDHGMHIASLDTNKDDPARKTVEIPVSALGFKVYAKNNASSNSIKVSSEVYETRVS